VSRSLKGSGRPDSDGSETMGVPNYTFPLICPKCGGTMKIFAFIDEGEAIRAILTNRGVPVDPPRIAPAGPPLWEATARQSDDALLAQPIPEFEFDQRIAW
jgi:hypothetical protein